MYVNYFGGIITGSAAASVAGKLVNFFNPLDYALNAWAANQDNKPDGETHANGGTGRFRRSL